MASSSVRGERASYPVMIGGASDDPPAEYVATGFVAGVKANRTAWFAGDGVFELVEAGLLIPLAEEEDPAAALAARQQEVAQEAAEANELEQLRAEYRQLTGEEPDGRWSNSTIEKKLSTARSKKGT